MELVGSIFVAALIAFCVFVICFNRKNNPTWKGIIISALLGCLPFYLILCFIGIMGEERVEVKKAEEQKPKERKVKKKVKVRKSKPTDDYENADDYGAEYENADDYGPEYEVEK